MNQITVPDGNRNQELYHVYAACVNRIGAEPETANSTRCIVCGGQHRFDDCNILRNTSFLRSHYIRYCQMARREASARRDVFGSNDAGIHVPSVPVNYLDTDDAAGDDEEKGKDFQMGRD